MKIAYAMAGHLRRFQDNPTLRKHLFDVNPGDVFVHTYPVMNVPDRSPCWHSDRVGNAERLRPGDIADLFAMYPEIKAIEIDNKECGADHLEPALQSMGFRWSWCRANALVSGHHKKYDLVFNVRPDLWLYEDLVLPEPERSCLYGGLNKNQEEQGNDGDVFLYGTPQTMQYMHLRPIAASLESAVPTWGCVGEKLVTETRKFFGYGYIPHKVKCGILRSNGQVMDIRTE